MKKFCSVHLPDKRTNKYILVTKGYCRKCRSEHQRLRRLKTRLQQPVKRFHKNQKILTGNRYGKLIVLEDLQTVTYGGRPQILWRCLCNCGGIINLPSDKLPHNKLTKVKKITIPKYESCEKCRQKTCPLCLEKYPYSHASVICPTQVCRDELRKITDLRGTGKRIERYKKDPNYRARILENARIYYAENAEKLQDQRADKFYTLSDEQKQIFINKQKEANRKSEAKRALRKFLKQSNDIIKKLEKK